MNIEKKTTGLLVVVDNWPIEAQSKNISSIFHNSNSSDISASEDGILNIEDIYSVMGCGHSVKKYCEFKKMDFKTTLIKYDTRIHLGNNFHIIFLLDSNESAYDFLVEAIKYIGKLNIKVVYLHLILPDISGAFALKEIQSISNLLKTSTNIKLASICGGLFSIYGDWSKIAKSYDAIVRGKSNFHFSKGYEYIEKNYENNVSDSFIKPATIRSYRGFKNGDFVLFIDMERTRIIKLLKAITNQEFLFFKRQNLPTLSLVCTLLEVDPKIPSLIDVERYNSAFGKLISLKGIAQLRVAIDEKLDLVTYHFNGRNTGFEKEERLSLDWNFLDDYCKNNLFENALPKLNSNYYGFTLINVPYLHISSFFKTRHAISSAIEKTDSEVGKMASWVLENNVFMFLVLLFPTESSCKNKGKLAFFYPSKNTFKIKSSCYLEDIAPTLLNCYGIDKSPEMNGINMVYY